MFGLFDNLLKKNYENITAKEVESLINDKNTQIIDVRESYEYKSGHIPKAKLIPLGQLTGRLNEVNKNKQVILVCASGSRSGRAANLLAGEGYNVKNMTGGMSAWRAKLSY
ncbi:rhodanese-like domain-containing protein [Vallitalea okinawensis]|uniref:rhodanese-like domain-containing protein n=1 Tax=Vallitalea okinawensis TaxID=2078660 RepID=UPI000CFC4C49|nr:rhodanese-like domain-containing protein [Vallitalea okinawensis]